jgi:hypothetical protein
VSAQMTRPERVAVASEVCWAKAEGRASAKKTRGRVDRTHGERFLPPHCRMRPRAPGIIPVTGGLPTYVVETEIHLSGKFVAGVAFGDSANQSRALRALERLYCL